MISNDVLKGSRTRLTKFRENLRQYKNKWKDYEKVDGTQFENDIKNTFDELIYSSEQILWDIETFYVLLEVQTRKLDMIMKFLYQSPHIMNNSNVKNEFDKDFLNWKEKAANEMKSLMTYHKHEP